MGYKVQVYVYDLSQGAAKSLGQALIGKLAFFIGRKTLMISN